MFGAGIIVGFAIGFIFALIGQNGVEKDAIKNGCVKLNGKMFEIIPWKGDGRNR
jgi:hypothetical protein